MTAVGGGKRIRLDDTGQGLAIGAQDPGEPLASLAACSCVLVAMSSRT